MKFELIDSLVSLTADRIVGLKNVTLAEEYLGDHFPSFPVLPGVMMLEAMTQAARWLILNRTDFATSVVVLKEAKNVRYGRFVAPGQTLRIEVDYVKPTAVGHSFKAAGYLDQEQAVSARLELACYNLADRQAERAETDQKLIAHARRRLGVLQVHASLQSVAGSANI